MSSTALPPQTLGGKVAIVTGSSRGIGATIAIDLARRGAIVCVTYTSLDSSLKAKAVVEEIMNLGNGVSAIVIQGDLHNATVPGSITVHFASIYDLNVRAPTLLTQAVLPNLRRPGRIINISSVGARAGFANLSMYCSSKAALEGLTRCWAAELGKDGTTVNAVAAGTVESEMLVNISKEIIDMQKSGTPVGQRVGTAPEIANVVARLTGAESGWMSGQVLNASGGWTMY